jgi:hypothetical protein
MFTVAPPCLVIVSINSPRVFTQGLLNEMNFVIILRLILIISMEIFDVIGE